MKLILTPADFAEFPGEDILAAKCFEQGRSYDLRWMLELMAELKSEFSAEVASKCEFVVILTENYAFVFQKRMEAVHTWYQINNCGGLTALKSLLEATLEMEEQHDN